MTRHLAVACLIYLALAVQPSLGSGLVFPLFRPWLPGIAVVVCVMLTDGAMSFVWPGVLGLAIDSLSGDRLGVHVIAATIVAIAIKTLQPNGWSRSIVVIGAFTLFGTFLWRSMAAMSHSYQYRYAIDLTRCLVPALIEGFSTTALLVGILLTCRLLMNAIRPRQTSSMSLTNRWSMLTGG